MPARDDTTAVMVVGVDGSDGAISAVRWAARHARETGAGLRLVYAATASATASIALPVPVSVTGAVRRRPTRSGDRVLAVAAAEAGMFAPQAEVSGRLVTGDAVEALVDASGEAALLVVGSRRLGRVSGSLVGSVGAQVAARAGCPTVVVRGDGDPDGPVVVAVDGSQTSEPALRFAFTEAARRSVAVVAVHAWSPPLVPVGVGHAVAASVPSGPARSALHRSAVGLLTDTLSPWRDRYPHVEVLELLLEGNPETALPESAAGAALTVVGTRGRNRLSGLLLGSTSQAVLYGADCPVAVVREADDT